MSFRWNDINWNFLTSQLLHFKLTNFLISSMAGRFYDQVSAPTPHEACAVCTSDVTFGLTESSIGGHFSADLRQVWYHKNLSFLKIYSLQISALEIIYLLTELFIILFRARNRNISVIRYSQRRCPHICTYFWLSVAGSTSAGEWSISIVTRRWPCYLASCATRRKYAQEVWPNVQRSDEYDCSEPWANLRNFELLHAYLHLIENRLWFYSKNRGETLCRRTCKSSPGSFEDSDFMFTFYIWRSF